MCESETPTSESHAEQPKRTHKRRSSIFHVAHRLEDVDVTKNDDDDDFEGKNENFNNEKTFDLPKYIESLRNERKAWKETLNARKSKRRKLQKQKSIVDRKRTDSDLSVLSESERSFLSSRPPYERICKNLNTLADAAVKIGTLHREIKNLNDRLTLKMEVKVTDTTKRIIEWSSRET